MSNFDKLVKKILETTTMASVGMPMGGTVFSSDKVYNPGNAQKPCIIGNGPIRRNKPELIISPPVMGVKGVFKKKRKKKKNE
jgi:hypothetical protein